MGISNDDLKLILEFSQASRDVQELAIRFAGIGSNEASAPRVSVARTREKTGNSCRKWTAEDRRALYEAFDAHGCDVDVARSLARRFDRSPSAIQAQFNDQGYREHRERKNAQRKLLPLAQ